jgi:uncharacterized membrane protein HdeD (DUF308 family)
MALFFLIGGLFQLIASIAVAQPGWGWQALDGIVTLYGCSCSCAVAGLRSLGDRSVRRD